MLPDGQIGRAEDETGVQEKELIQRKLGKACANSGVRSACALPARAQ